MRRLLIIAGIAVAAVVLIAAGLTAYAYFNLSSIVARNENRIVARMSDALGRHVEVGKIQAQLGWGVSVRSERSHDCRRSGILDQAVPRGQ